MANQPVAFRNAAAFRAWLRNNHKTASELIVRLQKVHAADRGITYAEALDEALCYGWIDGVRRSLDADSWSIRFSPRKPRSIWSLVNVRHAERLIAAGRMRKAGLAAFNAREHARTGVYSFEKRPSELPAAYAREFRASAAAWQYFEQRPPWYRRTSVHWVMSAKKEETRDKRFRILLECSSQGRPIPVLDRERSRASDEQAKRASGRRTQAKPRTIDEYLTALPPEQRAALEQLRQAIKLAAPGAEECISYQLPAVRLDGKLLAWFGAAKKHCAFYPGAYPIRALKDDLQDYEVSKGTIRFPADRPLPAALVRRLVKARIAERRGQG